MYARRRVEPAIRCASEPAVSCHSAATMSSSRAQRAAQAQLHHGLLRRTHTQQRLIQPAAGHATAAAGGPASRWAPAASGGAVTGLVDEEEREWKGGWGFAQLADTQASYTPPPNQPTPNDRRVFVYCRRLSLLTALPSDVCLPVPVHRVRHSVRHVSAER